MSFDAVRQQLATTFAQEFAAWMPGIQMQFDNVPFNQPRGNPFVAFVLQPNISKRIDLGSARRLRSWGLVTIHCLQPGDSGTKVANDMATAAMSILGDRTWAIPGNQGGTLHTYGCVLKNRGQLDGYFTLTLQIQYKFDHVLLHNHGVETMAVAGTFPHPIVGHATMTG